MDEAAKDALLVRAAIDIMAMQSHIALLADELNATKHRFRRYRKAVQRAAKSAISGRKQSAGDLSLQGTITRRVVEAYREHDGNIERVAKVLDVHRSRIYRLLPVNIRLERKRAVAARKARTCSVR